MLTHKQLRYFVEIVDAGGFSLAAERLFVAQSALSRQIREMESALGVTLLARDSRGLEMTPAGQSFYADACRLLAGLDDAVAAARHAERGVTGTVRLAHSSSVLLTPAMLACIAAYIENHPGVNIEISQASSEQQAQDIEQGRTDLALARAPVLRRYPEVVYETLCRETLVALVPAGHRLAQRASIGIAELREEAFVAVPHLERGGLSHRVAELCRAHGFAPQAARVRSRKWSQLALVQAGLGVAVVPRSMAEAATGVHVLELEEADRDTEVLLLWRRGHVPPVQDLAHALFAALRPSAPGKNG